MSGTETLSYPRHTKQTETARTAEKQRRLAVVAHGDQSFEVPQEALDDWVYPLFGIQFEVLYLPRKSRLEQLKHWLAHRFGTMPWSHVWRDCVEELNGCFHHYACVTLAKPSLHLPAESLVFETIANFSVIPREQLTHLAPRTQQRIHQSYRQAIEQFPGRRFHYMEPVYVGAGEQMRLAKPDDVRAEIARQYRQLQKYCRRWNWYYRAKGAVDEAVQAWDERARQRRIQRKATALLSTRDLRSRPAQRLLRGVRKMDGADVKEMVKLMEAMRLVQIEHLLDTLDPVITVEEPAWRTAGQPANTIPHRLVVHWDENKLKVLDI